MTKENEKKTPEDKKKETATGKKEKNILQKHPLTFLLLGALIITFLWGHLKANRVERNIKAEYELKMNDLYELTSREIATSLSWSLRSELTRNNKEQAEQYLLTFLRGNLNVSKVMYVDNKTKTILFSSDKKEEGKTYTEERVLNAREVLVDRKEEIITVISPVMGFNDKLGTIVFVWSTKAE